MNRPDTVFGVADVLTSSATAGEVRVNLGNATTGQGIAAEVPYFGMDGFVSCPNDSTPSGAAQALYFQDGNQKRIAGMRDNRWVSATGAPKSGDRFIVSNCAARFLLKKSSSAITIYTENQKDSDSSMILDINGANGSIRMVCGGSMISMTKDEIQIAAGGSTLVLNKDAITAMGKFMALATAGGCLGTIGPVAPPVGLSSILAGPSGMTGAPSTKWTIAT